MEPPSATSVWVAAGTQNTALSTASPPPLSKPALGTLKAEPSHQVPLDTLWTAILTCLIRDSGMAVLGPLGSSAVPEMVSRLRTYSSEGFCKVVTGTLES